MTDEEAVRGAVNDFAAAWNRHDIGALGLCFALNADFVIITGQRWKSRREIQANAAFLHGTAPQDSVNVIVPAQAYELFKAVTYRFDGVDVRFIHTDVAVAHVTWTQLGDTRLNEPRNGMLTFVATRDGNRWVLNAAQNTLV
jgi:Domain of unknown function (DUF4440)